MTAHSGRFYEARTGHEAVLGEKEVLATSFMIPKVYINRISQCFKTASSYISEVQIHSSSNFIIETENASAIKQLSVEGNFPKTTAGAMLEIEGIGHLPCDVIIEILSRLPAKHLCL